MHIHVLALDPFLATLSREVCCSHLRQAFLCFIVESTVVLYSSYCISLSDSASALFYFVEYV